MLMIVEHFKTEFVRMRHAKVLGRGRLALTLRQLLVAAAMGVVFNLLLRLLPVSNWYAVIGCGLGIWLGSEQAGAMQLSRLLMPRLVQLRTLIGKPQRIDLAATWEQHAQDGG